MEPMLAFSAVVLAAVAVAYWRIDDLVPAVQAVAGWFESTAHFERVRQLVEGR